MNRATFIRTLAFSLAATLVAAPAFAEGSASPPGFAEWLRGVEQDAISRGISPGVAHDVLEDVTFDNKVLELDQNQPEKKVTFADYVHARLTPAMIKAGREEMQDNAALLADISNQYGVPPEIIVALWGLESSFGKHSGDFKVVDSLATLAYSESGKRADKFRAELVEALRIVDRQNIPASELRGSWAGALGGCQFEPDTYLFFAVSYSGDHAPDIWNNKADVLASIANYARADGWNGLIPGWGREVRLTLPIKDSDIGLGQKHWLGEWMIMGVREADGRNFEGANLETSLIAPDGPGGRHFLVTDNYRALMKWNRSTYFATTVGLLANEIK